MSTVPQVGHFPFFPAAASGVRTCWRHTGQGNSMGMRAQGSGWTEMVAGQFTNNSLGNVQS
jgi:hypothetical protein